MDSPAACVPSSGVEADAWLLLSGVVVVLLAGSCVDVDIDGAGLLATPWTAPTPGFVVVVVGLELDVGAEEPAEPEVEEGAGLVEVGWVEGADAPGFEPLPSCSPSREPTPVVVGAEELRSRPSSSWSVVELVGVPIVVGGGVLPRAESSAPVDVAIGGSVPLLERSPEVKAVPSDLSDC